MLVAGIVFVILYIIGLGSVFARAIIIAPQHFGDASFQMRYKFLFVKFHSEAHHWGLVILLKTFLTNLSMCIASAGLAQLYLVMSVTIIYLCAAIAFMPFRHRIANVLDVISCVMVNYACSFLVLFADHPQDSLDAITVTTSVVSFIPILCALVCIGYLIKMGSRFPYSDKDKARAQKALDGLHGVSQEIVRVVAADPQSAQLAMLQLSEWDRHYLDRATCVIKHEIMGARTSSTRLVSQVVGKTLSSKSSMSLTGTMEKETTQQIIAKDTYQDDLVKPPVEEAQQQSVAPTSNGAHDDISYFPAEEIHQVPSPTIRLSGPGGMPW